MEDIEGILAPGSEIDKSALLEWLQAQGAIIAANKNGTDQTGVANDTNTKITFTNELADTAGFYDAANSRITPTRPCTLVITAFVAFASTNMSSSSIVASIVHVLADSTTIRRFGPTVSGVSALAGCFAMLIVEFDGDGDFVEIGASVSGGTTGKTVSGSTDTRVMAWEVKVP